MAEQITIKEIYETLSKVNFTGKIKQKIGLSYISWAHVWGELKKHYPDAEMKVYTRTIRTTRTKTLTSDGEVINIEEEEENEIPYFTDGKTCFVKVGVVISGIEYTEILPVMDNRNNAISLSMITMTAVNKAIQRCFTKAAARFGLGLFIYAGEDLPDTERKIIDFAAIESNCDRYQTVQLTEEGFNEMKSSVMQALQADYSAECSKAIVEYTTKCAQGKRLSLFTFAEDNVKLQRINNFIAEVVKAAAPSSGQ